MAEAVIQGKSDLDSESKSEAHKILKDIHRLPRAAPRAPSPATSPAPLRARGTSTDTSVPKHRAGNQCWVGLLTAAGKSRKGTEKSFRCLRTTAIHIQLLTSASPKTSGFCLLSEVGARAGTGV